MLKLVIFPLHLQCANKDNEMVSALNNVHLFHDTEEYLDCRVNVSSQSNPISPTTFPTAFYLPHILGTVYTSILSISQHISEMWEEMGYFHAEIISMCYFPNKCSR